MKNLSFLMLFSFVMFSAFAQETGQITIPGASSEVTPTEANDANQTMEKTTHSQGIAAKKATVDTNTTLFDRASTLRVYTNSQGLPITGSNNTYGFVGSRYDFQGYADFKGVLIAYRTKVQAGQADNYTVQVFQLNSNDLPAGQSMNGAGFSSSDILTDTSEIVWTHIPFTNYVGVQNDFAVLVQTRAIQSTSDSIDYVSIYSSTHGDGNGEKRAVALKIPNLSAVKIANEYTVNSQPLDIDVMILPILNIMEAGVEETKLEGLTFKGVSPNPAKTSTTVEFSLDNAQQVTITLVDMNGRHVKDVVNKRMQAGSHTINTDVSGLKAGMYFYTIVAGNAKMATKLVVE